MNKTLKLSEAIRNPPRNFSIPIPPSKANTYLATCLHALVRFPDFIVESHQLVATGNEKEMLDTLRARQMGVTGWLAHLIFNRGQKTPDALKNTYLRVYEPDARFSESLLKLAEGTCDVSKRLSRFRPDDVDDSDLPAWFWLSCEIGSLRAEIENSGLGLSLGIPDLSKPGKPATKVDGVKFFKKFADILEGIELPELSSHDNQELPSYLLPNVLLLSEARQIADVDDGFAAEFWEPYLKAMRRWSNRVRKDDFRQATFLLPDGSIHTTAKHRKRPKGFA